MLKRWYRLRVWWHSFRYRTEFLPFSDDNIVAVCDCGGHARIGRNEDGTATLTEVSCPSWAWRHKTRDPIPVARVLP